MRKVAPSGLQRCTQVKGATNKCPRKKKNLPHYHKPPKQRGRDPTHVRYTPPNICSVAATQSGVLLSQHTPKLAKKQKNKGCWLGKVTQKVIPRIKCPLFGLQHDPTCPLSTPPPPPPPCLHTVCTAVAVHTVPRTQHHQQATSNYKGGRQEVFFCPPSTRSLDLSHYNR